MGARAGGRVGGWVGGWVGSSVGGQNEEGVAPRLHTPTRSPTQHIPTRARPLPPPLPPCTRSLHYVLWGDDGSRTPVDLARLDRYALKLGGSDAWTELGPGDALLAAPPPPGEGGAPQPPPPAPKRVPLSPGGGGAIGTAPRRQHAASEGSPQHHPPPQRQQSDEGGAARLGRGAQLHVHTPVSQKVL